MLQKKRIIIAVTGSIAAYKAAILVRLFIKAGAEVRVLMTPSAARFVSSLTLSVLSKEPVHTDVMDEHGWNNHVEMGLWADAMIVAPATANTLAKMAHGICDNIVSAVYLSARCPVFVAPAMDLDMYRHPATLDALTTLQRHGVRIIPAGHGELASGLVGEGRLAEPEEILAQIEQFFTASSDLNNRKILITAGPTYEAIDPVRFVGNRSTGKMGVAIASEAAERGAHVTLILGPSSVKATHPNVRTIKVESARDMFDATVAAWPESEAAILSAAVADYRPEAVSDQKIKKGAEDDFILRLVKNPDIAAYLGQNKQSWQKLIGFALETNDEVNHAQQKITKKNLDFIVLNSLRDTGAGFGHDTNKVSIIHRDGRHHDFPLQQKTDVARIILDELVAILP